MLPLPWTPRPIAHRGLHREARGIVENTPSAVLAAIERGYAIEVDVQAAQGGLPVVFHDETLDRLTHATGEIVNLTIEDLRKVTYKASRDRIITIPELLEIVAGRVPLVIEVKTMFGPPGTYERRIASDVAGYKGPLALMSFDPWSMLALKEHAPGIPRGIVSYRWDDDWMPQVSGNRRRSLARLSHLRAVDATFVAYDIDDLPAFPPWWARRVLGGKLFAWTVRTPAQRIKAKRHADAMIFEGFDP